MNVSDASYYIQENNENKGSRIGHTEKIFNKNTLSKEINRTKKLTNCIAIINFLKISLLK